MKIKSFKIAGTVLLGLSLAIPPAHASWFGQDASPGTRGYFWYEVVQEDNATNATNQTVAMPEPKPEPKEEVKKEPEYPTEVKIPWDRVWTMHPKEFQKLMDEVQDLAVANPTPERMNDWYKLLYVASFRAKRFQVAADRARREMPGLDMSVRRSPTLVGSLAEAKTRMRLRKEIVPFMRERMGLILFYSPRCPYCEKEIEILQGFARKWGWGENIRLIDSRANHDVADKFGVQVTPDLWIVGNISGNEDGSDVLSMRLGTGLITISEIEDALMRAYFEWFEGKNYERPEMVDELVKPEDIIKEQQ